MKKILFVACCIITIFSIDSIAQNDYAEKYDSKDKRESKRETKKIKREIALSELANLARTKQWAIEADMVTTIIYDKPYVFSSKPQLNFLTLDDEDLVFQLAIDEYKGYGGRYLNRTHFSNINNYEVVQSKKSVNISMKRDAGSGPIKYYVFLNSSGMAQLKIELRGSTMNMTGKFIPLDQADIFFKRTKKEFQ